MKKEILKYLGVGFGALIILAFAIYFMFTGTEGSVGKNRLDKKAEKAEVSDDDIITVDEMPQVGDEIIMKDVELEDDSITYDRYTCFDIPSSTTYQIYILHNNLGFDVDVYMDIEYTMGNESQMNSIYVNNIPAKGDSCVWTMPSDFESEEISLTARRPEEKSHTIAPQINCAVNDNGNGFTATVTNNSEYNAYYMSANVLFKKGNEVVRFQPVNLYSNKEYIAPGESEEISVDAYGAEYTDIEIFFGGYGVE